jgi:putative ABC transport system permease protein
MKRLIREMTQAPAFSITIILLVAVGVGSATAIFAVVWPVLLKPLPYPESNRIVTVWENTPEDSRLQVSPADLGDLGERCRSFTALGSYRYWIITVSGQGPAELILGARVSSGVLSVLGMRPFLGRDFEPEEFSSPHQVVLISFHVWQQRFAANPHVLGQHIKINGVPYSIIGVMPRSFNFPSQSSLIHVWSPLVLNSSDLGNRASHSLMVLGKLRAGVSLKGAQTEVAAIMQRLAAEHPETNSKIGVTVTPLQTELSGDYRPSLFALLGASVLIVLIACANSAGLLLARGIGQERTLVIRKALGATNMRIIRERLWEAVFLSLLGAGLGLILAKGCLTAIPALAPSMPFWDQVGFDRAILAFALVVSICCALLFGSAPAIRASRVKDLAAALRGGVGLPTRRAWRLQGILVISETALALVLLVAAGLLIRTMHGFWSVPVGFNPDHVLTTNFLLSQARYAAQDRQAQFFRDAMENVSHLPGVKAAALGSPLPWQGEIGVGFQIEGKAGSGETPQADLVICSPNFFGVMEVPVIRGRPLADTDGAKSAQVALINQAMAIRYWPSRDPLGKVMDVEGIGKKEIVGITADYHQVDFSQPPQPTIFVSYAQSPSPYAGLLVRTTGDAMAVANPIRAAISRVDPDVAPAGIHTMIEILGTSVQQQSLVMALLVAFALIALTLSILGAYGFFTHLVALRRREFAIRAAVGASQGNILRLVLGKGTFLIGIGAVVGVACALATTRVLNSLLWGIKAADPATFLAAVLFVFVLNLTALYLPARKAMQVSPEAVLREE